MILITGPDNQEEFSKSIQSQFSSSFIIDLTFFGAVLHLRGPSLIKQPLIDDDEQDVILWNGEIFNGVDVSLNMEYFALERMLKKKIKNGLIMNSGVS